MSATVSSAHWMLECVIQFSVYYRILFAYFLNYWQFKRHSGSFVVNKNLIWSDVVRYDMVCCSKYFINVTSASALTQVVTGSVHTCVLLFCEHLKNHFYKHSCQFEVYNFFSTLWWWSVYRLYTLYTIGIRRRSTLLHNVWKRSPKSAAFRPYVRHCLW